MASLKNVGDDSPAVLPQSPQGLAIRDPGVLSSSHSFTDLEFQNRHTVNVGIGNAYEDVKLAGKGRERKHHHRHHHHHHHRGGPEKNNSSGHMARKDSRDGAPITRKRARTRSFKESDSDRPVTPPGERVIRILGEDTSTGNVGMTPKPIFSEMEELLWENNDSVWHETARWIRFEEDVEESGDRFSKPHVGTLSLHALFELRSFLLNGALLLDVDGSTLDQISSIVVDRMICTGNLALKYRDKVKETILKRHHHAFEGEKKKDDEKKRDDDRRPNDHASRSKSEPTGLMKLPIIRSLGSRASFQDYHNENNLMNDPYMLGKGNIHFMKKVPPGAEACNILVGEVDYLENPVAAFIRLSSANELGDLTEVPVPTRFIFLLLGTVGNLSRYHEVGRAVGTVMSDEVFHEIAYKAAKREHIIAGIDEFLDAVTVLPPGEWDPSIRIEPPDHLPSQQGRMHRQNDSCCPVEKVDEEEEERKMREDAGLVRTGRIFGGLRNDFKRKKPFYLHDFKDALSLQCIASWLFLYFACLTPIVTFGGLLGAATGHRLAAIESLVSGLISGIIYGLFSGQPLTILGSTGPVLVFESILYEYCVSANWNYLSFRLWTGIWVAVILMILVATDCSAFVCYITRFTEENFATLIAIIFMYEAIDKLMKIRHTFPIHPPSDGMNCFCKPPANATLKTLYSDWSTLSPLNCTKMSGILSDGCAYEPNVFFMSVILFVFTVILTFKLKGFKESALFPTIFRRLVSDFSVIIAIVVMTSFDYLVQVKTPKLLVPEKFAPTYHGRTWLVPILNGNPWWTIIAAVIPAILATILIFMDQQITAVIVNRRENKLKKGCGYHLDLFVLSFLIIICSIFGLPFFVAATVLSINHVSSLKLESETAAPGEKPQFLGVLEQRVTQLLIFSTIGISVFLVPVLKIIPMPVLYGIFLYMGASSLNGLQFVDRLAILLMPLKYQPDLPFLRKVSLKRVHIFTAIQLLCLIMLWVIKSINETKMLFPVMLVVLIAIRKLLDRYFTREELKSLDDILPDFKRKERDEAEEDEVDCCKGTEENEISDKPPLSPDGQAKLKIPMVSGNIMKISVPVEDPINISEEVKRCGVWKTVNSSNELSEKSNHNRHSKKSKRGKSSHKKSSQKNPRLSEIEEESFLKASFDRNDDGNDDDNESQEFITIKINRSDSSNSQVKENGVGEGDVDDIGIIEEEA